MVVCSVKPAPGDELGNELISFNEVDGFVTGAEPLLVAQPEACKHDIGEIGQRMWPRVPNRLGLGSAGCLKGIAGMGNVLLMLRMCYC